MTWLVPRFYRNKEYRDMDYEMLAETVKEAQQGDNIALEELCNIIYKSVYFLAFRLVKKHEDAEDLTQDVCLTVQEKIAGLRDPVAFLGWVNQIAANKCYRFLRKNKGTAWLEDEDWLADIEEDNHENLPDKAIDDEATRKIILEVIDSLPDNQRICIMLHYYAQKSIAEIAEILETNENTVKSRLLLARAKIKAALEEKEKKEGIKLWGIPLSLIEILQENFENFIIPGDVDARIRDSISKSSEQSDENPCSITTPNPQQNGSEATDIQEQVPDDTATNVTSSDDTAETDNTVPIVTPDEKPANTKAGVKGISLTTKVIISIATALIIAGILLILRMSENNRPAPIDTSTGESVTDPVEVDNYNNDDDNEYHYDNSYDTSPRNHEKDALSVLFLKYAGREVSHNWNDIYAELTNLGLFVHEVTQGCLFVTTQLDDDQWLVLTFTKDGINPANEVSLTETGTNETHYLFELLYSVTTIDFVGAQVEFTGNGDKYYICYGGDELVEVSSLSEINVFIKEVAATMFD